jgi:hypothetical protein
MPVKLHPYDGPEATVSQESLGGGRKVKYEKQIKMTPGLHQGGPAVPTTSIGVL